MTFFLVVVVFLALVTETVTVTVHFPALRPRSVVPVTAQTLADCDATASDNFAPAGTVIPAHTAIAFAEARDFRESAGWTLATDFTGPVAAASTVVVVAAVAAGVDGAVDATTGAVDCGTTDTVVTGAGTVVVEGTVVEVDVVEVVDEVVVVVATAG